MKDKITFASLVPGLADVAPVIKANEYMPKWVKSAREDYKAVAKKDLGGSHIMQCPGIFDLANYGYIVPMWHDVIVKTNGDGQTFQWAAPRLEELEIDGIKSPVDVHGGDITKYMPKRHYSLKGVIKFNTPWRIIAPKNVKFLMIPIAYNDVSTYDASIGILDPGLSNEVNIQVNWNVLNDEARIRAGQPLCQLIPITEKEFDFECRDANEQDRLWEQKKNFIMNMSFFPNRNKLKEAWIKHFRK